MLRKTRLAVLMAFAMILTTGIAAQKNSTFQRQQGDYILGFNGGVAYQQSDVANNLNGLGFGLTYGKNFIYAPHAPFSLDVRSRFQIARSFGTDIRPSLGIERNEALNGEKTLDYTGEEQGGFVYANHKTNQAEIGMEGVLTLNGLRETTGLGLSFTGGVGLNWYKTMIDQRNADGLYTEQYSQIDAGGAKPYNLSQLNGFRDGTYETPADGFNRIGKFGIMPSLGVELDYDLTNNLALGVGHRVTFSGTDLLDGQRWTDANALTGNNDILHYTSLGLKYTFNQKGSVNTSRKPTIELLEPYGSGLRTSKALVPIKAAINRVTNPFDVYLTVNGEEQRFNFNNQTLVGQIRLQPGENRIVITANNENGSAKKTIFLTYETSLPTSTEVIDFGKPEIEFLTPTTDPLRIEKNNIKIRAKVRLVDSARDIELRINGQKKRFDFDAGIAILDAVIDLKAGQNTIEIIATNRNGTHRLNSTIFRELPIPFPTVQFTSPAYNNATVDQQLATLKVDLQHIGQSSDIQLLVNGNNEPNFYFDYATGRVKADIQLREGRNEVEIIVRNKRGEARDQRTIIFKRPYVPTIRVPRVRINAPSYSQSTTREEVVTIHATIDGVFRKSDIRMTNNGLAIYDFDFNPNSGVLKHNLYLRAGINQVVIEAQNAAGRDGASATINFEVPILPPPPPVIITAPNVRILQPRRNDVFETKEIVVKANLIGVTHKRDIDFRVNDNDCVDFRFNPTNGSFRAKIPLQVGENVLTIRATNPGGKDRQRIVVFHEQPFAPIIDFKTPDYTETQKEKLKIKANIDYVDNKRAIQVFLNNRPIRNFKFSNQRLSVEFNLVVGQNDIEIIANNKYGRATKQWSVNYVIPQPPSIHFSNLKENQTFKKNRVRIKATGENINSVRDLKLFVNGVLSKNLDGDNGQFSALILLKEGRNSIVLKANTTHGKDETRLRINYIRPKPATIAIAPVINAPTIRFITSDRSRKQTQAMFFNVKAIIENIADRDDLVLKLNGKVLKDFEFDTDTGRLSAKLPLKLGLNMVTLQAQNEGGIVEAETTMTRRTGRPVLSKEGAVRKKTSKTKARF